MCISQQEAELARLRATGGGSGGASSSQAPSSSSAELEQRLEEALARAQAREEELTQLVKLDPLRNFNLFKDFLFPFKMMFFVFAAGRDEPSIGSDSGSRG